MGAGKILAILGGLITILGTFVFALYGSTGIVGSGLGFALNIPDLFTDAEFFAVAIDIPVALFYVYLILFIIFLASGILQMVGAQSRAVGFIFSLFPLAVGLLFILLVYTEILGITSAFFAFFFIGEQFGDFFPILVKIGDLSLGVYLVLAGGVLGILSVFMERD
ncbi:hypothetical protein LCGC14_1827200 [marine sediment metagenome]|uniref:Uncharacterized protein n=1 Tax=marine sediment metagenome TaxID=412755 RepID=A0A0F9IWQ5_9ZZZZ